MVILLLDGKNIEIKNKEFCKRKLFTCSDSYNTRKGYSI